MPTPINHPRVRIGIVDDYAMLVDGIATALRGPRYGFDVVLEATSWDALLTAPGFPPEVVILDLNLGDGIDIETKIRALRTAGCEVVIMSRHTHAGTVARAFRAGVLAYVPKTASADELAHAVRRAVNGHRTLPSGLAGTSVVHPHVELPRLGPQERRALTLYATGRRMREVAAEMHTTEETVKSYIKRARRKYRDAGIDIGTKISLRSQGLREGWLANE